MMVNYRSIWLVLLVVLLLATLITLGKVSPMMTMVIILLTLVPLVTLLPREHLLVATVFILPLAPHSMFFSESIPSMSLEFPFIALLGVVFLYPALKQIRRLRSIWLLAGCWGGFALLVLVSWFNAGSSTYSELFTINLFAYFGALLVLVAAVNPDTFDFKRICRAFYAAAFVVALLGLAQYFFSPLFASEWYINAYLRHGLDLNYNLRISDRILSTFGNPHTVGLYLGIILMVALGSNFWGFNRRWTRILWVAVLITAIILTRSRTVFICLFAGYVFLALALNRNSLRNMLYALGASVLAFGLLSHFLPRNWLVKLFNYEQTVHARFMLWDQAMDCFLASPILGAGPNPGIQISGSTLSKVPIDNIYLTVLASYGLLGLIVLLAAFYLVINQLIKVSNTDYKLGNMARGLGCGLLMLMIANLSGDFLFHPKVMGAYLLFLGCFLVAAENKSRGPLKVMLVGNAKSIHLQRWGEALARRGLQVHLLSPEFHAVKGCTVHNIEYQPASILSAKGGMSFLRTLWQVEKRLKDISPDLVHIHGAFSFGWYATSFTGGPVIATVWGGDVYRYANSSGRQFLVARSILKSADLVTVPTREVANYVQTRFGVKNTAILPWGIDEDVFYPRRKDEILAVRKQLALPDKAKVVLSPRNLTPLYNIDAIIGAIPRVLQVNSEVVFCFLRGTGSVAYEAKLMDRAAELGVKENTRWIQDFQTSEEMARLFSVADAFISIPDTDNLGSTIIEGLACGSIPVVKRLNNYQVINDAGAVMFTVADTGQGALTGAVVLALKARTGEAEAKNVAVAMSLGTWREAVGRMAGVYESMVSGGSGKGKKLQMERGVAK